MKTLTPMPIQIKGHFYQYLSINREELTPSEFSHLMKYSENDFLLSLMAFSMYDEWEAKDRSFNLETWTKKAIGEILKDFQMKGGV